MSKKKDKALRREAKRQAERRRDQSIRLGKPSIHQPERIESGDYWQGVQQGTSIYCTCGFHSFARRDQEAYSAFWYHAANKHYEQSNRLYEELVERQHKVRVGWYQ